MDKKRHVGFVSLVGRPNAGKSSFLNALIEEKVSGISEKPQTTQRVIKGIYNDENSQIVFLDTPGVHDSDAEWNKAVNSNALGSIRDADLILRFLDMSRPYGKEDEQIDAILDHSGKKVLQVYTKKDIAYANIPNGAVAISKNDRESLLALVEEIKKHLSEGQMLYPEDYYTDQDIHSRVVEIVREKLFLQFQDELPYATFVEVEEVTEAGDLLKIMSYIYTETEAQKRIVIGEGGRALTALGKAARIELEEIFDRKVFLALRVKVLPKWRKNKNVLDRVFG